MVVPPSVSSLAGSVASIATSIMLTTVLFAIPMSPTHHPCPGGMSVCRYCHTGAFG